MRSQAEEEAVRILIERHNDEFHKLALQFENEIHKYGGIVK